MWSCATRRLPGVRASVRSGRCWSRAFRVAGFLWFQASRLPGFRLPGFLVSGFLASWFQASWLPGFRLPGFLVSVFGVEAHRAVFGPGVLQQRDLVHADREQGAPVLAEPAFRIALADEDRLLQVIGGDRSAVRLLVAPRPGHRCHASLAVCVVPCAAGSGCGRFGPKVNA